VAGKTLRLHISSLEQLRDGFARREGGSVLMTSDFPDADLAAFVCQSGLPLIVFSDDPAAALAWTAQSREMSAEDATRFCSRIYASLAPNLAASRKLVVHRRGEAAPERVAAGIIEFLWPGRGDWLVAGALAFLAEAGLLVEPPLAEREPVGDEDALAALTSYGEVLLGRWPEEIDWPLRLFTRPDGSAWTAPFDLTGPARVVLYGPYMHLPAGDWTARVEFEIDGAVSGVEAMTDVRLNEVVTEKFFEMPAKGIYAYDLNFHVSDPHHAVEIRLFTRRSVIEGVFLPRSVRVRPQRRVA
jgi:hypothetical protein